MSAHRFLNGTGKPLIVWIEPWCEEISVPPNSTLIIRQEGVAEGDETIVEPRADMLVFWCGGSAYTAELDGEPLVT